MVLAAIYYASDGSPIPLGREPEELRSFYRLFRLLNRRHPSGGTEVERASRCGRPWAECQTVAQHSAKSRLIGVKLWPSGHGAENISPAMDLAGCGSALVGSGRPLERERAKWPMSRRPCHVRPRRAAPAPARLSARSQVRWPTGSCRRPDGSGPSLIIARN